MARSSFPARDVSSWAPRNRQPQGCDTTRLNPATPKPPHWKMQRHDVQLGSDEGIRNAGGGSGDLSLASSLLASFVGRNYVKFRRVRTRTPRKSHGCYTLVLLAKASPLPFIATRRHAKGEPVNQQCMFHGRIHGSIHGRSQSCNSADSPNSNVSCEH